MGVFGTILVIMLGLAAALYMFWGMCLIIAASRADRRGK